MALAITLHLLAAVIWVGGMFFAYMSLRPVAAAQLEPPQRLPLWSGVFRLFFPWVWMVILLLPVTGYWMLFAHFGGFGAVGKHVHIMHGVGLLMIAIYLFLYFVPYAAMNRAINEADWPRAGAKLGIIRRLVGINLLLGLFVSGIAAGGRYTLL